MSLFQKKPTTESSQQLYTLGNQKTFLIVGLGNPGKQYESTRHNLGFTVVDSFAKTNDFPAFSQKKDLNSALSIQLLADKRVILCKPETFMNDSGQAVAAVQHFYKLSNQETLVIYDELAIPFGQVRSRGGGSDAGHNGVKSIINYCGESFYRLRIGIDNAHSVNSDAADFVLAKFNAEEKKQLPAVIREASALVSEYIFSGQLPDETRKVV